jgi:hypothetical protein
MNLLGLGHLVQSVQLVQMFANGIVLGSWKQDAEKPCDPSPVMRSSYGLANEDIFPQQASAQWSRICLRPLFQVSATTKFSVERQQHSIRSRQIAHQIASTKPLRRSAGGRGLLLTLEKLDFTNFSYIW